MKTLICIVLFCFSATVALAQNTGLGNLAAQPPAINQISNKTNNSGGTSPMTLNAPNGNVISATYSSGGTATGSGTCLVTFISTSGNGASGVVTVTSGTIGSTITMLSGGGAYTAAPTTATLTNQTATTCSGTATVSTTLGITQGNVLGLACTVTGVSSETWTFPTGFNLITGSTGTPNPGISTGSSKLAWQVGLKTATSSEPSTYSISWGTNGNLADCVIINVPNVSATVDGVPGSGSGNNSALTISSTTPVGAGGLLLTIAGMATNSGKIPNLINQACVPSTVNVVNSCALASRDSLAWFATTWGSATAPAATANFGIETSTGSSSDDNFGFQFVLPTTLGNSSLNPLSSNSPHSVSDLNVVGNMRAAAVSTPYVVIDNETSGGTQGLYVRNVAGWPLQFLDINSADVAQLFPNKDIGFLILGPANQSATNGAFIVTNGCLGWVSIAGDEDICAIHSEHPNVITSIATGSTTVLTLARNHEYPIGMPITITGATGTGCSGMNAQWIVIAAAAGTATIPFPSTGCTYGASSASVASDDWHAGSNGLIPVSAPGGNVDIKNTIFDLQANQSLGVTYNSAINRPYLQVDSSGVHGAFNRAVVTSNFTTASTSLVTITGLTWTIPAITNNSPSQTSYSFRCHMTYSQATAAAADAIGVQASTTAPTNLYAQGIAYTNLTTAPTNGVLPTLASTTATNVVAFTPGAAGSIGTVADMFPVDLWGTLEPGAGSTTLNIMILTGSGSDSITVYRGSYCELEM